MSILGRLSNLIKSNLNSAIDKVSDPAKEVDLLITEMEEELLKLRGELRDAMVQEKLAQKRVDEAYRGVQKWQEHAERAVQAGEDDLAKEALIRQAETEQKLGAAESNLAEHSRMVAKLHGDLKSGEAKLTEIKGKREALKSRARAAHKVAGGEGTAFDRFSALVSEIEDKEHQAEAMAELEPELRTAAQEDRDRQTSARFDRLLGPGTAAGGGSAGKDDEISVRLRSLKAKLDKPSSPDGQ
jgi:phage shock protein A